MTDEMIAPARAPRLLEQVSDAIRRRHYSRRTEEAYVYWIKRFIYFSDKRHPREMGAQEVTAFLSHLARDRDVAASTQNQALSALLFLYKEVLGQALPWLDQVERAKRPARVPTVLSVAEVQRLLAQMQGTKWLMASLLYGAGLRLRECLKLRVKDIDFDYRQIMVRDAKGGKDRVTMLPALSSGRYASILFASGHYTSVTSRAATAMSNCRMRSHESIRRHRTSGAGSSSFPRTSCRPIRAPASSADTTFSRTT